MAVPFITAKRMISAKLETTRGTAIAVADADTNFLAYDIQVDREIENWLRPFASGRHSYASPVKGRKKGTIKFKHDLQPGAAATTAPTARKLFLACGALETVGGSNVVYSPDATKDSLDAYCLTMKVILIPTTGNAILVTIKGAMGNCVIKMENSILVCEFEFTGAFSTDADGTALVLTSPNTTVPPVAVAGATITVAAAAVKISKMEFDFGNTVELEMDPADTTGYLAAYISKRKPMLRLDPQALLVADAAHYTRWAAGTQSAFSLATATNGSLKWTLAAPKCSLSSHKIADRNGMEVWDQEYEVAETSGSDEWSLTQSA